MGRYRQSEDALRGRSFREQAVQVLAPALVGEFAVQHVADLAAIVGWTLIQVVVTQTVHDFPVRIGQFDAFLILFIEVLCYKVPVDEIPEGIDIFHARIAVVDVVGMLPDVAG